MCALLAIRILIANSCTRCHWFFNRLSQDGGSTNFFLKTSAPHSLMTTYRMNLLSARSISLDSTLIRISLKIVNVTRSQEGFALSTWKNTVSWFSYINRVHEVKYTPGFLYSCLFVLPAFCTPILSSKLFPIYGSPKHSPTRKKWLCSLKKNSRMKGRERWLM